MNDKREMLRHFLAALAYRTQKALCDMPPTLPASLQCCIGLLNLRSA